MSETDKYKVPTNAVKAPDNDTGYKLIKKNYRRFIWTWNDINKNKDDYKLIEEATGENIWNNIDTSEISGMGRSNPDWIPQGVVGYKSGPMSKNDQEPITDEYIDPDDLNKKKHKNKLNNIKTFEDFEYK